MGGASTQFAGKGLFYRGHQFNTVKGKEELLPELDDPEYVNSWGCMTIRYTTLLLTKYAA
ncbi:hypothetical protein HAALTHF_09020n [Vreelandella aquamarina]|nr:hypothetical protein HAALTHF_09020n [Halomonas axialensis]